MSNKPSIYGFCPAGCKWETVHKDDFDRSAAFIALQKVDGSFRLDPLKTYRIKKSTDLWDSNYGFQIALTYTVNGMGYSRIIYDPTDVPLTDVTGQNYNFNGAWKEFLTVRLCSLYRNGEGRVAVIEYDGKIFYALATTTGATEGETYENVQLMVSGTDECCLVNEHAEILSKSAYGYAVDGGYTGTEEEFAEDINPDNMKDDIAAAITKDIPKLDPHQLYFDGDSKIYQRGADLASDTRTLTVNGAVTVSNYVQFDGSEAGVADGELVGRWVEIDGKRAYVGMNTTNMMALYYDEEKTLVYPITCADDTVIYPAVMDVTEEVKDLLGGGNVTIPTFDLVEQGLPAVPMDGTSVVAYDVDNSDIFTALDAGVAKFLVPIEDLTAPIFVNSAKMLSTTYMCTGVFVINGKAYVLQLTFSEDATAAQVLEVLTELPAEPTAYDLSAFDESGRITETYADGTTKTTKMEFDEDGNPVKITDGDGNVVTLTW